MIIEVYLSELRKLSERADIVIMYDSFTSCSVDCQHGT